jgi:Uma2 family endonuclease
MKQIALFLILILSHTKIIGQITFRIESDIFSSDLSVKVSESVYSPDVTVKIGSDVYSPDFTVGISSSKKEADFIITKSTNADISIKASESIYSPDISIKAGESVYSPDVTIKILKSGTVDYIVYTEKDFITMTDLIVALLPAINKKLDYKLKGIPVYIEKGSNEDPNPNNIDLISLLNGSSIIAQDNENTYLGKITSQYNTESVFNEYGKYGSEYNSSCIWNEYSTFGNEYNSLSPFNDYSSKPPMIIKNGKLIGYLTTNKTIKGGLSPNLLLGLKDKF